MKKVVITAAGVAFLLALSSETGKLSYTPGQESQAQTRVILTEPPDSPHTLTCRISGTFIHENGRCLVIWFEYRNRYQKGDCLNLQIDLYLYNARLRGDRTITKRINFNP